MTGFDIAAATGDIDPELMQALSHGVNSFMADLSQEFGESAEAWRGAGALARDMLGMMRFMYEQGDARGVSNDQTGAMVMGILAAVMRTVNEHPATVAARRI